MQLLCSSLQLLIRETEEKREHTFEEPSFAFIRFSASFPRWVSNGRNDEIHVVAVAVSNK